MSYGAGGNITGVFQITSVFQHADKGQATLLRPRRDRPRNCRAADKRDELAELHSIASSASASIAGEHVRTERLRDLQVELKFEFCRRLRQTRRLG